MAAIILFAMLFTVGTTYFLYVNLNNQLYTKALSERYNFQQNRLLEQAQLTTGLDNGNISFVISNMGSVAVNITAVFLIAPNGAISVLTGTATSPPLPILVNAGANSTKIDTKVRYPGSGTYVIRALSSRGSAFVATYPYSGSPASLALQALTSGAFGDLYLQFNSFVWYNVTNCGSDCWQLSGGLSAGKPAFSIRTFWQSLKSPAFIAFGVNVTNLNPQQEPITLDKYSYLVEFVPCISGCGNQPTAYWYIASYDSNGRLYPFTSQTLYYGQPVRLIFVWESPTSAQPTSLGSIAAPTTTFSFIVTHGCRGSTGTCSPTQSNYGQSIPFLSTLFYWP